jgi:hypothetical protein
LNRELGKQKNSRKDFCEENYGLANRKKSVNARCLYSCERGAYGEGDQQDNNNAKRKPAMLRAGRNARNESRNFFAIIVS